MTITSTDIARTALVAMARRNLEAVRAGGHPDQEPEPFRIPASTYVDPDRWRREVEVVFRRLPLMLALGGELPGPGSYKAMEAVGVPVLLTRDRDGRARAFVNMCSHRGAVIVPAGLGEARRLTCPYHGWSYDPQGTLVGITDRQHVGIDDTSQLGLTELPCEERAGLIFASLTPGGPIDLDAFLAGYDEVLSFFEFGTWHLVSRKEIEGPNWKIAYDGYLDFYHLPVLHKATFGPEMSNRALYDVWGPHQRVSFPNPELEVLDLVPEAEWDLASIAGGVWTIFPHVSFAGGRQGGLISQLFPGPTPDSSLTIQSFYTATPPETEEERQAAQAQADFLEHVVRAEDYATGFQLQRAVATGAKPELWFGRNEGGGHRFHRHLDELLEAAGPHQEMP